MTRHLLLLHPAFIPISAPICGWYTLLECNTNDAGKELKAAKETQLFRYSLLDRLCPRGRPLRSVDYFTRTGRRSGSGEFHGWGWSCLPSSTVSS